MTTLSVIVPAHDSQDYVATALASLEFNKRDDFETIVINDGSSDRTGEIAEEYAERNANLRVLHNATPVGPGGARNQGLAVATGRYVTYLDADDWIGRGHLAALVEAIEHLRCDFVRVDMVRCFGLRRELHRTPESRRGVVLSPRDSILPVDERTSVDYPFVWAGIYDRRLADVGLLTFATHLHGPEDRLWTWRLHLHARSFAAVSLAGNFYRREVPTSLTTVIGARQLHYFDALDLILAEVEQDDELHCFMPKVLRSYCLLILLNVDREARLPPALQAEQRARAGQVLRAMPARGGDDVLKGMGREREATLRALMAPGSDTPS